MNINRGYVSLETEFCSVCVFLIITPSKPFALVFDFSALLGDNLNWNGCIPWLSRLIISLTTKMRLFTVKRNRQPFNCFSKFLQFLKTQYSFVSGLDSRNTAITCILISTAKKAVKLRMRVSRLFSGNFLDKVTKFSETILHLHFWKRRYLRQHAILKQEL